MAQEAAGVDATLALKELREKTKRAERVTIIVSVVVLIGLFLLALIPTGFFGEAVDLVNHFEQGGENSRNAAQNCKDPRNRGTAYCQEREAQTDSDWRSMSRFQGGKSNQFTLHGRQ